MNACRPQSAAGRRRRGFTLVELLVVILIIGLLLALVSTAVMKALTTGKQAVLKTEIEELHRAVQAYSNDNGGEFPPSFASYDTTGVAQARIVRHIQRRWPRYTPRFTSEATPYLNFRRELRELTSVECGLAANALDPDTLDQGEALVLWLGGLPSQFVERRLLGFSKDPALPFAGHNPNLTTAPTLPLLNHAQRTTPFGFDSFRLVDRDDDNWLEYVPKGVSPTGDMPPYVYFDSLAYTSSTLATGALAIASYPSTTAGALRGPAGNVGTWGRCWPMWRVAPATGVLAQWQNSDSFQIFSAGLDGAYSTEGGTSAAGPALYPALPADGGGVPDWGAMQDNIANFGEGTLQDERERQR